MTESIAYTTTHSADSGDMATYLQTGMLHIEDAAKVVAHADEYGSCALTGVMEDSADAVARDIQYVAEHGHGMKVLAVDDVVGTLHGPATRHTFEEIRRFAHTYRNRGIIVIRDVEVDNAHGESNAISRKIAAEKIAELLAFEARPKVCVISSETADGAQREHMLGVLASYVSFSEAAPAESTIPLRVAPAPISSTNESGHEYSRPELQCAA